MHVRTIGPVKTPLWLNQGQDPRTAAYASVLEALPADSPHFSVPNRVDGQRDAKFARSNADDLDLRLFVWNAPAEEGETRLRLHVYPMGVSVFETFQDIPALSSVEAYEDFIQKEAERAFEHFADEFSLLLKKLGGDLTPGFADPIPDDYLANPADIEWTARCIVLSDEERQDPANHEFIRGWLKPTARPEEAETIIEGALDVSMTWLAYIVVQQDSTFVDSQFSAIRTAQAFYAAQQILNLEAQEQLVGVPQKRGVRILEKKLLQYRRRMQILRILFETQKGFLSRERRRKFDDVMDLWDFDDLIENGNRIVAASADRIGEILSRRTERSAAFTDSILFGIALFAIIEVALYLTEYSREMMSRPALSFEDDQLPFTLRFLAGVDADFMLLSGIFITIILIVLYAIWKRRG